MDDWRHRPTGRFRPHHRRRQVMAPRSTAVSLVTSTVLERSSSAKNVRRASILVSSNRAYCVNLPHLHADTYTACSGACGIVDPGSIESWTCDLCQNEKTAEVSLVRPPHYLRCFYMTNRFRRAPIACSVLGPSASVTRRHSTHLPTRSCAFASQLRVRAGCTSPVRCSYPKYHSPTQSVCASSRGLVRFLLIAGLQCVEFFVPL